MLDKFNQQRPYVQDDEVCKNPPFLGASILGSTSYVSASQECSMTGKEFREMSVEIYREGQRNRARISTPLGKAVPPLATIT